MTTYIAILRGINVGGRRKILMADLSSLFQGLGFANIQTYIQSGNVVFETNSKADNVALSNRIEQSISKTFGFEVPVIIRTDDEIEQAISNNPFLINKAEVEGFFLTFLKDVPSSKKLESIKSFDFSPDKFEVIGKDIFGFCAGNYHKTKLSNQFFESKLKVSATTRIWKTANKLVEMANS